MAFALIVGRRPNVGGGAFVFYALIGMTLILGLAEATGAGDLDDDTRRLLAAAAGI